MLLCSSSSIAINQKADGYFQGDAYPLGEWRPREGVKRGSVMDTVYPGDPLTPGVGATTNAVRLALKDVRTITKIPVLPISSADALPLMSALKGPVAPEAWRGALPMTYHVGPGPAEVHLHVTSHWDRKPIYDVIATLPGSQDAEQWVIRGNHHDAWVNGAEDPLSGQAAMQEEARVLGLLHHQGWRPKRTILYCAWDGEEPGLLGSVEWVETHLAELQQHAVAYLNSDSNERGFLNAGGTQDLQSFVSGVAREIPDPETQLTVYQRARLRSIASAKNAEEREALRKRSDLVLDTLGDGSDFTAFQDLAGIPTLSLEFGGEGEYAERNLQLSEGVFKALLDPRRPLAPPPAETVPPFMKFAPLKNALVMFRKSAARYTQALQSLQANGSPPLPGPSLQALNARLLQVSRMFLNQQGLPGRPWYKNQIYAPGAYTGHDAKPIAAVREYMDEKQWQQADAQVPQVARIIEVAAAGISKAAEELENAQQQH